MPRGTGGISQREHLTQDAPPALRFTVTLSTSRVVNVRVARFLCVVARLAGIRRLGTGELGMRDGVQPVPLLSYVCVVCQSACPSNFSAHLYFRLSV